MTTSERNADILTAMARAVLLFAEDHLGPTPILKALNCDFLHHAAGGQDVHVRLVRKTRSLVFLDMDIDGVATGTAIVCKGEKA